MTIRIDYESGSGGVFAYATVEGQNFCTFAQGGTLHEDRDGAKQKLVLEVKAWQRAKRIPSEEVEI